MTRRVKIGDVLELRREPVAVDALETYIEIGVRSFGRGIFHKEPTQGHELGAKRVFWIHPGDLIFNNVFAWEGAVALATESEAGKIGSHRFLTYVSAGGSAEPAYLRYLFMTETGLRLLGQASPGSAGRNRTLAIDRFEALEISLPDLAEQRRIVAKLDALLGGTDDMRKVAAAAVSARAVGEGAVQKRLDDGIAQGWSLKPLGEVALVNPPPARLVSDDSITFVPMSAVDDRTGMIKSPEVMSRGELKSTYKQFQRGDVIFARITPCMQNGKSAVADDISTEYGYGSTEFHVLRPSDGATKEWIHRVIRTRSFRDLAAARFTGTAGQQRVPADFLRSVEIPVPDSGTQARLVEWIDRVAVQALELDDLYARRMKLLDASEKSILNHAFAAGL